MAEKDYTCTEALQGIFFSVLGCVSAAFGDFQINTLSAQGMFFSVFGCTVYVSATHVCCIGRFPNKYFISARDIFSVFGCMYQLFVSAALGDFQINTLSAQAVSRHGCSW
jgi:hypothetical protein